jgi:hypothetical protein
VAMVSYGRRTTMMSHPVRSAFPVGPHGVRSTSEVGREVGTAAERLAAMVRRWARGGSCRRMGGGIGRSCGG